ncbi:hypothetical protein HPB52_008228 [Rhipicephalus sanguineus]|uniref:RING-type domain-containing protein n=1 Tax=Rhipicephalus sanguineus TaxID=34632 RepID=A0A9D4QF68_RHISA|nr:hypothetical protein HPB52_008228 [Rhipicephalus sanguineus]
MDDTRQRFMYRVCGFGDHTEWKIVEFLEELDDVQVCSWCGVVSTKAAVLSCSHMVCEECRAIAYKAAVPVCWIDKETLSSEVKQIDHSLNSALQYRKVHCVNFDTGWDYAHRIDQLDEHLRTACAFYLKECSKCEESVVYKDLVSHYKACKGLAGVFVRAVDGQPLLDDILNARRELEQALALTSSEVRDTVGSLTDQLEMLRSQLTMRSGGRADNRKLSDCRQ